MKLPGRRSTPTTLHAPADYVVIKDRCWDSPSLDSLVDGLADPRPSAADKVSWTLQHLQAARSQPEWAVLVGSVAAEQLTGCLDELRARAHRPSGDRAADADVLGLLADTLVSAAWDVRGDDRASTVSRQSFATFHDILGEADEVGRAGLDLMPGHPVAGVARLGSGLGLGLPADEAWSRFDEARSSRPTLMPAHSTMMQMLCKKWYGNHRVMFDFARKATAEAPVGDPIGVMLVKAHLEYLLEEKTVAIPVEDMELVAAAADRWIAGGPEALAHPAALAAHQWFGWFLADDPERGPYHLRRTKGRMSFLPWGYLPGNEEFYRGLLAAVNAPIN